MKLKLILLFLAGSYFSLWGADKITQYGIIWKFDKDYPTGQFATGDYWVVGPIKIIGITTDLHDPKFTPGPDDDGSMVNPGTDNKQGYDGALASYKKELNASRPNGKPISPDNPLVLPPNSSLISMVSWLYTSKDNKEPGIPKFNGGTKAPRPVTRSGAILTVLDKAPPAGSFRPPYCGQDKTIKFNIKDLDYSKLKNLEPVAKTPDPAKFAKQIERPWIDHVHEYLGAMVHPSENMPNYGREMGKILSQAGLLVNLDFTKLPGQPKKDELVMRLVQFGIDSTGIADAGGGWPENGGHGIGRKFPILFAGVLLNDQHMLDVGNWKTRFHDNEQTFYVTQESVDITNSPKWKPDSRAKDKEPYEAKDIGMPEWGVRHTRKPQADNRGWRTNYRGVNGSCIPNFALAIAIMDKKKEWNHNAYLDYAARYMEEMEKRKEKGTNTPPGFVKDMWNKYHEQFGLVYPKK